MCLNIVTNMSSKITLSLKYNHPCRPLSSAITTDLATIKESTISNLVIEKEGTAKYPYPDNEASSTRYVSEIHNMWI
jgi:hypothetical protein